MKVMIIGSSSGVGLATADLFRAKGHQVVNIDREAIDLERDDSDELLRKRLTIHEPDVIINCAGYLGENDESARRSLSVNVESNWSLIRYYVENPTKRRVKIIMVGSSAYRAGKKQYMMYSASKAAVHNLWEGARDYFENTPVTVSVLHPVRTRTKMTINRFSPNLDYFEPEEVAEELLTLSLDPTSKCVCLTFEGKL